MTSPTASTIAEITVCEMKSSKAPRRNAPTASPIAPTRKVSVTA
jgi:hypothetical protein